MRARSQSFASALRNFTPTGWAESEHQRVELGLFQSGRNIGFAALADRKSICRWKKKALRLLKLPIITKQGCRSFGFL